MDNASFYDSNWQLLPPNGVRAYTSQYGLQGKIFAHLAKYMDDNRAIFNLYLLCCLAAAVVFVVITLFISAKYNNILAGCFYVTFWLSPWITNFARNLYWVEFTWFIPMAAGLFCAWKIESRKCRLLSYITAFISVTVKCLCGYEYVSTIMMGLISFLFVDFVLALVKKDRKKGLLLLRSIIIIGASALAGFMVAICVHAQLRGNRNILEGIKSIIERDALRRTVDTDAKMREVLSQYFHFYTTEVICGIPGNLFHLLCLIPLFIFLYEFKLGKLNVELVVMYFVFFLATISWFCLAKQHSYIHTHLNYVLWYFGFVQVCFYIILNKLHEVYKNIALSVKDER